MKRTNASVNVRVIVLFACSDLLYRHLMPMNRLTIYSHSITSHHDEFKHDGSVTLPLCLHIADVTGLISHLTGLVTAFEGLQPIILAFACEMWDINGEPCLMVSG